MAEAGAKFQRKFNKATSRLGITPGLDKLDKFLAKKGAHPGEKLAEKQKEKKEGEKTKKRNTRKLRQAEDLRLAEVNDEIGRRKLLARRRGAGTLIGS